MATNSRFTILTASVCLILAVPPTNVVATETDPANRTADLPDSWLVLYNLNDADSVSWSAWYQSQWNIPSENLLGLNASSSEHLADLATADAEIFDPIRVYLAANPDVESRVMGIVLGYRLPGHYGSAPTGGPGGKSIASALQDLNNADQEYGPLALFRPGPLLPAARFTKADLPNGHYMAARIDAPTLALAQAMTTRAKSSNNSYLPASNFVWYDYTDPNLTTLCHCWGFLEQAVENAALSDVPWVPFDSDTEATVLEVMRFGTHDINGWNDSRLRGTPGGARILAYNFNSWGATTVRSTSGEGGRYVPNAIDAGYAAAIGSTGEPASAICPYPDTILAALREGWTLGESFYSANPRNDWMWTLVGDPLLRVPHWFGVMRPGDLDGDGDVDLNDFADFVVCISGPGVPYFDGCEGADLDADGDVDLADFGLFANNYTGSGG